MRGVVITAVLAGAGTTVLLVLWRGFFWQHALIIGVAVVALLYTTFRTIERLRNIHRP